MSKLNKKKFIFVFLFSVLAILIACGQKDKQQVEMLFDLYYQGKKLSCENLSILPVQLNELRFYVHDLSISEKKLSLGKNKFQHNDVAYLDFAASNRHCDSKVALVSNQSIFLETGNTGELNFKLGVPQNLNHQNPVKTLPPLNRSDMHWQWLSGYKFLRLEYLKNNELNRLHLGSTACSGKIPDNVNCEFPNRLAVELVNFDTSTSIIEVHIDELLKPESGSLCMGKPKEENCQLWFNALEKNVFKIGTK